MDPSQGEVTPPTFVRASQPLAPPGRAPAPGTVQELKSGCETILFDSSSTVLASILDEAPTTVWVWDVAALELRATLIFHSNVASIAWHPDQPEVLLIQCEGDRYDGRAFMWDPLSDGPQIIDFQSRLPSGRSNGRSSIIWLRSSGESPTLFYADRDACLLGSLTDDEVPWQVAPSTGSGSAGSPPDDGPPLDDSDQDSGMDARDLEDTFHFRNHVTPRQ